MSAHVFARYSRPGQRYFTFLFVSRSLIVFFFRAYVVGFFRSSCVLYTSNSKIIYATDYCAVGRVYENIRTRTFGTARVPFVGTRTQGEIRKTHTRLLVRLPRDVRNVRLRSSRSSASVTNRTRRCSYCYTTEQKRVLYSYRANGLPRAKTPKAPRPAVADVICRAPRKCDKHGRQRENGTRSSFRREQPLSTMNGVPRGRTRAS